MSGTTERHDGAPRPPEPTLADLKGAALNALQAAGLPFETLPLDEGFKRHPHSDLAHLWVIANTGTGRTGRPFLQVSAGDPKDAGGVDTATFTWCSWKDHEGARLDPAELADAQRAIEAQRRDAQARKVREQAQARAKAATDWQAATADGAESHPYLVRKQVGVYGVKVSGDSLLIPVRDTAGTLHGLQRIGPDGDKRFTPGTAVTGHYHMIGEPTTGGRLFICEGYATAASVHEATGAPVALAFNAGNLPAVAKALQSTYPDTAKTIAGDDDTHREGNPGRTHAEAAARLVGAPVLFPVFADGSAPAGRDWNDLAQLEGAEAVRVQLEAPANKPEPDEPPPWDDGDPGPVPEDGPASWPEPQPLTAKIGHEPYPTSALPPAIWEAVQEVARFVQAPIPLVVGSALSSLSVACQGHVDVQRAEKLQGPTALFLLGIADSGERKTTCDSFFTDPIRQYEAEQDALAKPEREQYEAKIDAWTAERDGLLSSIKTASTQSKADKVGAAKAELARLQGDKPEPPRIPRVLLGDETPENLAFSLAKQWPSAAVISSEAGLIFGAHGMGKDSVLRNLALLNLLWDGGEHKVGRRTSECFTVRGARLTVALQIQDVALRSFFDRTGALARGTGFLARFLLSWPESTQGYRPFTDPPATWPRLSRFHARIASILNTPLALDDDGALTPILLRLSPDAKLAWIAFHDNIETELRSGGELHNVRDVASKTADNAVRLAALFHVFASGMTGEIGLDDFEGASRIAAWHLSEARRFFGELALPPEMVDAVRLDAWLVEHCRREGGATVGKNYARQHGPLRDGARLGDALQELSDLDRLRLVKVGRTQQIAVNPALVEVSA